MEPVGANLQQRGFIEDLGRSAESAAKTVNVSQRSVNDAKWVQQHAPQFVDAVRRGEVTVHGAKRQAKANEEAPPKREPNYKAGDAGCPG
jgi:hypothetical protein